MVLIEYAKKVGAKSIVHGSTGAGNDQVRFDLIFSVLAPEIEIITPIRDNTLSREEEIEYLKSHGYEFSFEKSKYSVNKGIWGTSVGGAETLTSSTGLPESAYPSQLEKSTPEKLTLEFKSGELSSVNGQKGSPTELITLLEEIAASFAIGRDIHVGDTILGIKGRVGFEAARTNDHSESPRTSRKTRAYQVATISKTAIGSVLWDVASRRSIARPGNERHRGLS